MKTEKENRMAFFQALQPLTNLQQKKWLLIGALLLVCIVILIVGIATQKTVKEADSRIIKLKMENIGELSTQAAFFSNVQVISNTREVFGLTVPFTQSKYIFSYDGVIKAGIDFAKLTYSVDASSKTITVYLPEPYITSVSVDENSLKIYDESQNLFTPLKLDDLQNARLQMETEAQEQAVANGLLEEASQNAKVLIQAFLFSDDAFSVYELIWKSDAQ